MVHSSLFIVHGSLFIVHGSLFIVHGSWFMVHGSMVQRFKGSKVQAPKGFPLRFKVICLLFARG